MTATRDFFASLAGEIPAAQPPGEAGRQADLSPSLPFLSSTPRLVAPVLFYLDESVNARKQAFTCLYHRSRSGRKYHPRKMVPKMLEDLAVKKRKYDAEAAKKKKKQEETRARAKRNREKKARNFSRKEVFFFRTPR